MSLRDKIDGADDANVTAVTIATWGLDVLVRRIPADILDVVENAQVEASEGRNQGTNLAVMAGSVLCDETGELLYDVRNPDDMAALGKKTAAALLEVVKAAGRLNKDWLAELEDAAEKSESVPASDSGSA